MSRPEADAAADYNMAIIWDDGRTTSWFAEGRTTKRATADVRAMAKRGGAARPFHATMCRTGGKPVDVPLTDDEATATPRAAAHEAGDSR